MPGKILLGPLDENAATRGASTSFPTLVRDGVSLTTGTVSLRIRRPIIEAERERGEIEREIYNYFRVNA